MSARAEVALSVSRSAESGLTAHQAGYFFDNSQRTGVIQSLSRARHRGIKASLHRGGPSEARKGRNVEMSKRSGDPDSIGIGIGIEIRGWE